jgi:hypothetical protein
MAQNLKKTLTETVPAPHMYVDTARLPSGCVITWQTNIPEATEMYFNICICSLQVTVQM